MASIFEEAWNSGKEWASDTADDVKDWATEKAIEHKIDQIKKDLKKIPSDIADAFVSYDKLTPELIKQGWKIGLDDVPYNSNLKYTGDDWARDQANAAADARIQAAAAAGGGVGGGGGTTTDSSPFKLSQDLRQRTPSGTIYNPDLSAYNDSSLFNYTGPGGVPEYTYGQGLPTDGAGYDIWGTPTDVPNPYYWGQFGEGYVEPEETGIADGAITLPPIDLPDGVSPTNNNPNVGTPDTNIPTNTPTGGNGDKDLNYFETLAAMGIDPSDAPSTTFPGINDKVVQEGIINKDAVKTTLPSGIIGGEEQVFDGKYNMLPSDDGAYDYTGLKLNPANQLIANDEQVYPSIYDMQASDDGDFDYTGLNRNIANDEQVYPSIYDMQASDDGDFDYTGLNRNIANDEQVYPSIYDMQASDDGDFDYTGLNRNIANDEQVYPSLYDMQASDDGAYDYTGLNRNIANDEQVYDANYNMQASDDGSFNYGANNQANFETANNIYSNTQNSIIRNPNEETQPYRGIYVDPRTVPEINAVQSNTTYPPSFPADYDTGSNINLVTTTDKEYEKDVPIVFDSSPLNGPVGTSKYNTDNWINPDDYLTFNFDTNNNNNYVPKEQYGLDEAAVDAYKYITSLFKDDSATPLQGPAGSTAPSYTGSINTGESQLGKINAALSGTSPGWGNSRIWENPPEPSIFEEPELNNDIPIETYFPQYPLNGAVIQPSIQTLQDEALQVKAAIQEGLNTGKYIIDNSGKVPEIKRSSPVNVPSIFKPKPAPVASVYAAPGGKPELTISQQAQAKQDSILAQAKAKSAAITAQAQAKQKSITQQAQKQVYQKQYEQLKKAGAPVRRSGNRYGFGF